MPAVTYFHHFAMILIAHVDIPTVSLVFINYSSHHPEAFACAFDDWRCAHYVKSIPVKTISWSVRSRHPSGDLLLKPKEKLQIKITTTVSNKLHERSDLPLQAES